MNKYVERLVTPTSNMKLYSNGTFNPFAYNYGMFANNGNCTAYAYGRMNELLNKKSNLPTGNAGGWYDNVKGYEKGKTPKLGAIAVWRKNNTNIKQNKGHVAVVERIENDGILFSESGWKNFLFRTKKRNLNAYMSGYTFQGYIYCPIEFEKEASSTSFFLNMPSRGYFKYGDKGNNVKDLQSLLNRMLGSNLEVDGCIGNLTVEQIKNFQKKYNLKIDGYFGPACMRKAKEVTGN